MWSKASINYYGWKRSQSKQGKNENHTQGQIKMGVKWGE